MKTKNAKEVFEKVKEVYLQLRNENLPVIRIHADRAHENYSAQLRSRATDRDIVITRTEGQDPAANGVAQRAIRFLKGRAKLLLATAQQGRPSAFASAAIVNEKSAFDRELCRRCAVMVEGAGEAQGVWSRGPVRLVATMGLRPVLRASVIFMEDTNRFTVTTHLRSRLKEDAEDKEEIKAEEEVIVEAVGWASTSQEACDVGFKG